MFHFKEVVLLCHKRDVKAATDGGLKTTRTMKLPDFLCFTTELVAGSKAKLPLQEVYCWLRLALTVEKIII